MMQLKVQINMQQTWQFYDHTDSMNKRTTTTNVKRIEIRSDDGRKSAEYARFIKTRS